MRWYLTVLKKYTCFSGRAGLEEFWSFVLCTVGAYLFFWALDVMFGAPVAHLFDVINGDWRDHTSTGLPTLYYLLTLSPTLAVFVRRLHDTNHSGLWSLLFLTPALFSLRPVVETIVVLLKKPELTFTVLVLSYLGPALLLLFAVRKGDDYDNQYGPQPE